MDPTKGKAKQPLPDLTVFDRVHRNRYKARTPKLRSSYRYNPLEGAATRMKCADAFATLRDLNLSTQREGNFIPYTASKQFSEIVLNLKASKSTSPKDIYTYLVFPLITKITSDNVADLMRKLKKPNITENEKSEHSSKIEFFDQLDYKVFTSLIGLMNAQGWKKDNNGQPLRPLASHQELGALNYLAHIRSTFARS